MTSITIVAVNAEQPQRFAEENISGVLLPGTRHTSSSIAIVAPGEMQSAHVQNRPDAGAEIIFVYDGTFELLSEGRVIATHDATFAGPAYISVPSGTEAHFRNPGTTPLRMFSVFAPPFAPGEIVYSDNR